MDAISFNYWIWAISVFFKLFIVKNYIVSKIRLLILGSKLPGPRAWPIIGNGIEFAMPNLDILDKLSKYNHQYGLVRFWLGPDLIVVICTAEDAEIFCSSTALLDRSSHIDHWKTFLGDGLLTASGHHWKKAKKLMEPAFRYSALRSFVPVIQEKTDVLIDLLEKEAGKSVFPFCEYIKNCTFDIATKALANIELNAQVQDLEILKNVDELMIYLSNRMYSLWQRNDFLYGFTKTGEDYFRRAKWIKGYIAEVISLKKKSMKESGIISKGNDDEEQFKGMAFIERLIQQKEWNDEELLNHMATIIFTGYETSSCQICFIMALLGIHQDVQEKLYQEISSATFLQDEQLNDIELARLEYLDKVIKESMRLFPIIPINLRKATDDVQFGKHLVPKGAAVAMNVFDIHRSPKYYTNPEVFDPEHFSKESVANRHPYAFIPFSKGARKCIGEKFSFMTIRIIISKILLKYKIECDMKMEEISVIATISLKMTNGCPIRLLKRQQTY